MIYDFIARTIAKSIGLLSPAIAAKYMKNQHLLRAYTASKNSGINRDIRPSQSSGAQETVGAWQAVANKSRDLDRNNPYVVGMRKRFVAAVVGEGSWPRPKIYKGVDKFDFDRDLNASILARHEEWADSACANGDSLYQLQRIVARALFVDGAILVRRLIIKRELKLEAIECDRLDTTKDTDTGGMTRTVNGIELDAYNKPLAYWIKPRFPTEFDAMPTRVLAADVLHIYDRQRASDITGICGFASVVMNLYGVNEYRQATMNLARVATGFGVFVKSPYPADFMGEPQGEDAGGNTYEYVSPGAIHYLRPGEEIAQVKPENPGAQYEGFVRSELRAASVGAGVSYESASNDGSQGTFASTRQMLLYERAQARYTFAILEEQFYRPAYEWFVEHETSFKGLALPGYDADKRRYLAASWSRPKTEWVDQLKDTKSAALEVKMGINTLTEICEVNGRDIEEIIAARKYEKELMTAAGLVDELDEIPEPGNK